MKDVDNHDDILQWVSGGYFLLDSKKYGKLKIASLVAGPGMPSGSVVGGHWTAKLWPEGDLETFSDSHQIHPTWPMCGAINIVCTKNAVWVDRLPKKQWKRTFMFNCTTVTNAQGSDKVYEQAVAYEKQLVCSIFEPEYFTYKQFKAMDWATCAINPSTVLHKTAAGIKVYLYADYVGVIKKDNFHALSPTIARRVMQQLGGDVSLGT